MHRQRAMAAAAAAGVAPEEELGAAAAAAAAATLPAPVLAPAAPLERQLWLQGLASSCALEALAPRVPNCIRG